MAARKRRKPGRKKRQSARPDGPPKSRVRTPSGPQGGRGRLRDGVVRETDRPGAEGQALSVEDHEGLLWAVECLGEPVQIGDRIAFEVLEKGKARRGEMIRLVQGDRQEWVCRVSEGRGRFDLIPFGGLPMPPFAIPEKSRKSAVDGDRVVVRAASAPRPKKSGRRAPTRRNREGPHGIIVEVLGQAGSPDADFRALAWKHRVQREHSRRARLEADAITEAIPADEIARRLDLRAMPFITVDPASARDHDDAVYAEQRDINALGIVEPGGNVRILDQKPAWTARLWVAIADVAHYVEPGTAIDADARRRGNSFYFPDRAVAMLPERLSTEICSLVPNVDRLAMVAELRLLPDGRVGDALFHEAVIRSHARLSYEEAAQWLAAPEQTPEERPLTRPPWLDSLRRLATLSGRLFEQRRRAGAVMLELPEVSIEVDETGQAIDACVRERNPAHALIEEAMLAANRAVAARLETAGATTLHRVHPPPPPAKLEALSKTLATWMPETPIDLESPHGLARALEAARGQAFEERAHSIILRSMSQARYEAEPGGHFALRFEHYLHFTSPIRRYADLDVHRALKRLLRRGNANDARQESSAAPDAEPARRLAAWLSGRERVAMDTERESVSLASCALLAGRVGDSFEAKVAAASAFGLFVRLEAPAVNGLVPIRSLSGYWTYDDEEDALIAEKSGARIGFGDSFSVRLLEVDFDRGRLAFEPLLNQSSG